MISYIILLSFSTVTAYYTDNHANCDNVYGAINSTLVAYLGQYQSTNECIHACIQKSISPTNRCESYTYYKSSVESTHAFHCYGRFGSIYGVIWTPLHNQIGVMCGRIIYPCKSNIDCELNGFCNTITGNCTCNNAWKGPRCQTLNLLPATKGNGYHLINDRGQQTSSWGGAVLMDKNNKNKDTKYHMYLSEMDNHCGLTSWKVNSRVIHAQSTKGYNSVYQRVDIMHSAFAHEPDAIYGNNGEIVLYYATYNYTNYTECVCEDGSTPPTCITPDLDHALFTDVMQYSTNGPNGAWSEPQIIFKDRNNTILKQKDDTNLAGVILGNGSFVGMLRCGNWDTDGSEIHLVTAYDWKDVKQYVIHDEMLFPQLVPIATEDPFIYLDCDEMYHAIFHNMSPTRHDLPGGSAYSVDGVHWIYAGSIYGQTVQYTDGSTFTFSKRQRPHFIFADDGCTPIALTTGVQYVDNIMILHLLCYSR